MMIKTLSWWMHFKTSGHHHDFHDYDNDYDDHDDGEQDRHDDAALI